MKTFIFASFLMLTALAGRAQPITQQTDSTPVSSPWVQVHTPGSFVTLAYVSLDTCWAFGDTSALLSTDGGMAWHTHSGYPFAMRNAHEGFGLDAPLILKTYNAWQTWDSVSDPLAIASEIDIVDSLHVYIGGSQGGSAIAFSSNGGTGWGYGSLGFFSGFAFADGNIGYAVGPSQQGPKQGEQGIGAFKTTNGGSSWVQLFPAGSLPNPYGVDDAHDVAVINDNTAVMVGGGNLVARTTDGGNTWQAITTPSNENDILEGIVIHGAIGYITGFPGLIWRTTDTGKTWTVEQCSRPNDDLPRALMYGDSLAAIGADSGIILIRNGGIASVSTSPIDSLTIAVFPNPSQSLVTLSYSLPSSQTVTITVFDINGNTVATLLNGVIQNTGNQSIPVNTSILASGTYFFRFSSQNYSSSGSFIVTQ